MQKQNNTIFKESPETMEAEFQTEIASSEVVHVVSPVAHSHHIIHKSSSEGVVTNHTQFKFSRIKTVHGELSRAAGVVAGDSRHPRPTDETALQRHRILRRRVWRRRCQPSGPCYVKSADVTPLYTKFTGSNNIRRQVEETPGRFLNMEQFEKFIEIGVVVVTQMSGSSEKLKNLSLCLLGAIFVVYAMELWVMPSCKVKWKVIIFGIASNSTKLLSFYLLLCMLKPEWLSWCGFFVVCIIATAYTCSNELKTKFTWCCVKGVLVINYVIHKVCKDQASAASAPTRASV
ncbi:hypothetical protein Tco_1245283 [Tanacetum coccineum]